MISGPREMLTLLLFQGYHIKFTLDMRNIIAFKNMYHEVVIDCTKNPYTKSTFTQVYYKSIILNHKIIQDSVSSVETDDMSVV